MVYDQRIPGRSNCVSGALLDKWAQEKPGETFLIFEDGESWSYGETRTRVRRAAAGFKSLGVSFGEHVLSWQPNGKEAILTWFGLNYLGAVYVPVNINYKGQLLQHAVTLSEARVMVCHSQLVFLLEPLEKICLQDVIVTGDGEEGVEAPGLKLHSAGLLSELPEADPDKVVEPWDTATIIYTSGTTGPSKAVLSSYVQSYAMASALPNVVSGDRFLVNLPLYHVGGTVWVTAALIHGASCVIENRFDTATFWGSIRKNEVTIINLLGVMSSFLLSTPTSPNDKNHCVRLAIAIPWSEECLSMKDRFGFDLITVFNMTEVATPLVSELNPTAIGTCGKSRDGVEVRVVDDNDCEVAPGEVGELIVRCDTPWAINHGYYQNADATAEAWRNGWFHTGDSFRFDEDGNFFFVDRKKDSIRRRGENISSFEVESEVLMHPAVEEVAAIPVPSELSEDEVMIIVAAKQGHSIDTDELFEFLKNRMSHFMLPRYIRVVDSLPKTPTQKVIKHQLRSEGITNDTWDREEAGIRVRGARIV
jgi:crotonobetaine/carnitine-CoA ligase